MPSIVKRARFEKPQYYSDKFETALRQLVRDISASYLAGVKYDDLLNSEEIFFAWNKLNKKFRRVRDDKRYFPNLKTIVNYIYTRDEALNPFGKYFKFSFWEPLIALDFAKHKMPNARLDVLTTIASIIMVIKSLKDILTEEELSSLKKSLRYELETNPMETKKKLKENIIKDLEKRLIDYSESLVQDKTESSIERKEELLDWIEKSKNLEDRPIQHYSPRVFYRAIGVGDYRYFVKYEKLLWIKIFHEKRKVGSFNSVLWIFNYDRILWQYDEFLKNNSKRYKYGNLGYRDILKSGVSFDKRFQNRVKKFYANTVRDPNIYQLTRSLHDNPFLFIGNERKQSKNKNRVSEKSTFYIQSYFFNFEFILSSLYQYKAGKQTRLTKEIKALEDKYIQKKLSHIGRKSLGKNIAAAFEEIDISNSINQITTPKDKRIQMHFNQIEMCREIIDRISQNGIGINKAKMENEIARKIEFRRSQLKSKGFTSDEISEQEKLDEDVSNHYIDDEFKEDKVETKTPEIKLRDLLKLRLSCWKTDPTSANIVRVYGKFSPHGARSHRMTSRGINIQGISEDIRENLFAAPYGKILLSADVAGQDIVVAAALAKRLYDRPDLFKKNVKQSFGRLNKKIERALVALSNTDTSESNPIDFITDNVLSKTGLFRKDRYRYFSRRDFRKLVKRAVYTRLYGGNKEKFTFSESRRYYYDEMLSDIIDMVKTMVDAVKINYTLPEDFTKSVDLISKGIKKIINTEREFPTEAEYEITEVLSDYLNIYEEVLSSNRKYDLVYFSDKKDIKSLLFLLDELDKLIRETDLRNKMYEPIFEVMDINYPGILESFQYYRLYYEENGMTYPTLLGWQTIVDAEFDKPGQDDDIPTDPSELIGYYRRKKRTRSKSYPTQGSGAEFIRQWLIEFDGMLPRRKKYKGKDVKIVNAIHDQIYVEAPIELKDKVKKAMISTAKMAAKKVGIDKRTLHIPVVVELPLKSKRKIPRKK